MYPIKIQIENNALKITWDDEKVTTVTLQKLRDECPCVNCKGESVIFESYIPLKTPFKAAGFYEIQKIDALGNYAIQITWKDGHNTGIYSWDILRKLSQ